MLAARERVLLRDFCCGDTSDRLDGWLLALLSSSVLVLLLLLLVLPVCSSKSSACCGVHSMVFCSISAVLRAAVIAAVSI
jgi:hypothetical protein